MPAPRVLNFEQPYVPNAIDKSLESFSKTFMEGQDRRREADALEQIYKQYQGDEQNILGQTMAIHSNPNIGPSAKVNAIDQLTKVAAYNREQQKESRDALEKQRKREAALRAGVDPDLDPALQKLQYENKAMGDYFKKKQGSETNQEPALNPGQPLDQTQTPEVTPKKAGFEGLSDADLIEAQASGIPALARGAAAEQKRRSTEAKKPKDARETEINKAQAKADFDFVEEQTKKIPEIFNRQKTFDQAQQLNAEGVTGKLWDQAMQMAGFLQYTSDGYRQFATFAKDAVKNLNIKAAIGSQISQLEFGFFRDSTISERFSPEANAQILKKEMAALRYEKLYADITKKIVDENNGIIPPNIQQRVNKEFAEQSGKITQEVREAALDFDAIQNVPKGKVLMFDKKRRPLHVPANEVEKYSKPPYGATLK